MGFLGFQLVSITSMGFNEFQWFLMRYRAQCATGIWPASFEKLKVEARSEVSASKLRQN